MSNLYSKFRSLVDEPTLRVGVVTVHNADGTSTLEDYHGCEIIAQGQEVALGSSAFVKDKRIQGQAPTLTETTVYV